MDQSFPIQHCYLIPLLPLAGAMIAGFFFTGARKPLAHWPVWGGIFASTVLSVWMLVAMIQAVPTGAAGEGMGVVRTFYTWIEAGNPQAPFDPDGEAAADQPFIVRAAFLLDPLTGVMLCVVCGIGFLITVYAAGYMKGEEGYFRFFAFLGLFIFAMTCLVMGDNLIMLYLGWEGVGLCSYLLIGYYYDKPSARDAAKKAFIVNRIGDFGFALGIMLSFLAFGTVSYFGAEVGGATDGLLEIAAAGYQAGTLTTFQQTALDWIPFLLMLGAFGKSAQFPLYVWLPDAMEGPTPVSALIHAATMVTAGVYMIARCGPLFVTNEPALITIAVVGAFTALFAATIALRQYDLKKVFAYSTISQLGYMFVGVAVLAPVAGVFHLVTHAFFKALLFLSSGVVMHAMAGELDMRKMSGLKRVLPKTRWLMLIGCIALAGLPLFSGFFSKDEIIAASFHHSRVAGAVLLLAAFLTSYYTFRLYYRVFEGPELTPSAVDGHGPPPPRPEQPTIDEHLTVQAIHHGDSEHPSPVAAAPPPAPHADDHAHEHQNHDHEPALMIWPLVILAVGAIFAGYLNFPRQMLGQFLGHSPSLIASYQMAAHRYAVADTEARDPSEVINPVPFGQPDRRPQTVREIEHRGHYYMMLFSGLLALSGWWLARQFHLKDRDAPERIARRLPSLARLLESKYWVDEIYERGIVDPLRRLGLAMFAFDRMVIDGLVWLIGFIPQASGFTLKLTMQRGYLQGYALMMALGIAAILVFVFVL